MKTDRSDDLFSDLELAITNHAEASATGQGEIVEVVTAAKKVLEGLLDTARSEHEKSSQLADKTNESLAAIKNKLAYRIKASGEAQGKVVSLEKDLAEQREGRASAEDRASSLDEELKQVGASADESAERANTLQKQVAEQTARADTAEERLDTLDKELELRSSNAGEAENRVVELEKELSQQTGLAKSSSQRVAELATEVNERTTDVEQGASRVLELEEEITQQRTIANKAQQRVEELEANEMRMAQELVSLRTSAREAAASDRNHAEALENTELELKSLQEEFTKTRDMAKNIGELQKLLKAEGNRTSSLENELAIERKRLAEETQALSKELEELKSSGSGESNGNGRPQVGSPGKGKEEARRLMGEILVGADIITLDQLNEALDLQRNSPQERLGDILVKKGFATEDSVAQALAYQRKIDFIRVSDTAIDKKALKLISGRLAEKHACIPLSLDKKTLVLAMANPLDLIAIEDIERASERDVDPVVATPSDIHSAIEEHYSDA